jgi:hypothetical protein
MNKIYAIVGFAFLAVMLPAQAQHNHRPNVQHIQQHHHYHYPVRPVRPAPHRHYHNNDWVVPAIIGGAVVGGLVYGATRPPPVYQPPVQYYSPPVYVDPTPQIPYGYRVEQILDASCNCYRTVLVPN